MTHGRAEGETPALPSWLGAAIRLAAALVWLSVAVQAALAFAAPGYNWDLDHEMYFGTRLLAGELIWTREFHDKLPFTQILFALPAWAGSIQAWRALSLALCLGAAAALIRLAPRAFPMGGLTRPETRWLCVLAGGVFTGFALTLPGGISVINPAAGALALIGTLMVLADMRPGAAHGGWSLLAGALAIAAAISLRPYFAALLALAVLWGGLRWALARRGSAADAAFRALVWGGWIGLWGMILNVLPYLVTGQYGAFRLGLAALGSDLYGRDGWTRFVLAVRGGDTYTLALWGILAFGAAIFAVSARPRARTVPGVLFVLAAALALTGFTAVQRWWSHYAHFPAGHAALLLVVLGAWLAEGRQWRVLRPAVRILSAAGVLVLGGGLAGLTLRDAADPNGDDAGRAAILATFEGYRAQPGRAELPFLAPSQIFLHWKLDEPRHGFPQSANTGHIARGWWAALPQTTWIAMPRNTARYCELLLAKGPALVAITRFEWLVPCIEGAASPYRLDAALPLPDGGAMRIYLRAPKGAG